jgi:hypothetical protein
MCKGTTVRKFGVELEGYMDKDLRGESFHINNDYWSIKDDGSLHDDTDRNYCDDCDGSGYEREECDNCCGTGEVEFTDGAGNTYEFECRECQGERYVEHGECETCDGSGYVEEGTFGSEIVSPPITDTSLIYDVYRQMHKNGWSVDENAGLHIHVDAGDYNAADFAKLTMLMTAVEPLIYSINDSYRYEECDYSLPLSHANDDYYRRGSVTNLISADFNELDMGDIYFTDDRYIALNFKAFRKHGTIEFRHFSPQEQPERVAQYVEIVTKLVDFAKNASYEQARVVYDKIIDANFATCADVLVEVLELPYDLKALKENRIFDEYERVRMIEVAEEAV